MMQVGTLLDPARHREGVRGTGGVVVPSILLRVADEVDEATVIRRGRKTLIEMHECRLRDVVIHHHLHRAVVEAGVVGAAIGVHFRVRGHGRRHHRGGAMTDVVWVSALVDLMECVFYFQLVYLTVLNINLDVQECFVSCYIISTMVSRDTTVAEN